MRTNSSAVRVLLGQRPPPRTRLCRLGAPQLRRALEIPLGEEWRCPVAAHSWLPVPGRPLFLVYWESLTLPAAQA